MHKVAHLFMKNTTYNIGKRGYAEIMDYGLSHDGPDEYYFDGELMFQAVREQLDNNFSQYTLTRYASCLFYMGEFQKFLWIMKNKLEKFYPEAWICNIDHYTACKIAYDELKKQKARAAA